MCNSNKGMDRRALCKAGLGVGAGAVMLGAAPGLLMAQDQSAEPHYFLQLVIPDGMDSSYSFDARPLAMTAAGLQSNYLGVEPTAWEGRNGRSTLATKLVEPLKPFKDDFSILNGVHMAVTFDGHPQNLNYLFTGNPFGGASFIPHLNDAKRTPLDFVQTGFLFSEITNGAASMPLFPGAAYSLVQHLKATTPPDPSSALFRFMQSRMTANAQGGGRFSLASKRMAEASNQVGSLARKLRDMPVEAPSTDDLADSLKIVSLYFKADITRSAVLTIRPPQALGFVDTHGPDEAKNSEALIGSVMQQVATVFAALKSTPYDDHRSMLDMTTVAVGSEFTRSMRQPDLAIDATGTNHNPLTNTILLGGKGIKGGLVIGESDSRTPTETLSAAHLAFDPEHYKVMGRPFDVDTMLPVDALPAEYHAMDYLSAGSVANTIFNLFGVDPALYWQLDRSGAEAKVLKGLLA